MTSPIDADSEHNGRRARGRIRQRHAGALHRKGALYGIDHAAELDDGTIADQLHDAAVVGGDGGSKMVSRCRFRAASVPASSASIRRE
jgi:hypothetical protein